MKKIYKITILGGTDGFGKWLAEYILEHFSRYISELTITGRNEKKLEQVAMEFHTKPHLNSSPQGENEGTRNCKIIFTTDNIEAVQNADIVIYSVPISKTQQVIEETLPYIKTSAIVSDVTSIKGFSSRAMSVRDDIIVIPTHPMFGPYIQGIAGQVIVLTPEIYIKTSKEYLFLRNFLLQEKAKVVEVSSQEHDRIIAVVQGLTHLNMFVIGETMKRLNFHIGESLNFVSPIYKLMISSVGRYLGQNPELYADIQMYNEEVIEVHEAFLETAKNFHTSVSMKDKKKFIADVEEARGFIGKKYCDEGQVYTDKLIYMLSRQQEILKNNIGNKIELQNIYSGEKINGVLEKHDNGKIFLKSGEIYTIDEYEVREKGNIF
ncbi:prephenate dehydrogenase/arogenate dehydrogenase family protein [Candidatus Gracilibacteria bacterium]|nr:prephenate dehydrogenase/arogenate dehydrogenase family protein [Candidatus Gracilibacteria bacterium]